MKHIKKLRFLLPLLAICLLIAGATPASAAEYEFLSSTDDLKVTLNGDPYTLIDGVKEANITLTKDNGTEVEAHVVLVKPWAKASLKPVIPGYYTEGSTAATRAEKAANWKDSDWSSTGVTNMVKQYESAADTKDKPVIAAIAGDFSNAAGNTTGGDGSATRGPIIMEGNILQHSATAADEFFFGMKSNGAVNIAQCITGQKELFEEAICGPMYILRNGTVTGFSEEFDKTTGAPLPRQRTGVAYRTNGDMLLITVQSGILVEQLGELMKASGCWNGVNLDGGGSINFQTKREGESLTRRTPDCTYADIDENKERRVNSALMLVADEDAVANKVPDNAEVGNTVETDKNTYLQGDPINVTATTDSDGAWVGIIDANDTASNPASKFWYYVYAVSESGTWCWENGETYDICTDGISAVGGQSSILLTPGVYKVAVMNHSEDGYDILASKNITIEHNPDFVTDDYTLKTDKDVYEVGEPIMTTITAPITDATAWVGITEHGHVAAGDNATYYWYYNSATNAGIGHANGMTYNLLEQEQIGNEDINDANVNASLIDRENRKLLPGTYDIIVYPADGYTPATDKDGNVVKKTITIIDTEAVYTITYKDGENDLTGLTPETYTYLEAQDAAVALPETAEKEGHDFAGWYEKADFSGNAVTSIAKGSNGNKTFYGKFNPRNYEVTFDTDGGTAIDPQEVAYGTTATKPADPEKDGCVFLGWETESGATYTFEEPITGNTTVYAKWADDGMCLVTFNTLGGSVINPVAVENGKTVAQPVDPTREGYTFVKWVKIEGGRASFDFDEPITADVTAYASWQTVDYTVTYNTDGGQAVAAKTYTIETDTFEVPVTKKDGYKFLGWKDADGNTVTEIVKGTTGNITLTAQWQREAFMTLNKTEYTDGEAINVTAYCENADAWVGIYKADETPGAQGIVSYYWTYIADFNGEEFNILKYKSPDNSNIFGPGTYKVILFGDGGYTELFSETITITESNNPAQGELVVSGAARDDKEYSGEAKDKHGVTLYEFCYGDAINVKATVSGDGTENAWVGVVRDSDYKNGITTTFSDNWFYVSDFEGQTVNLNYVNKSVMSADAVKLKPYGLNYWIVLVSDSGKILDGVPFNHRTFNVDWYENMDGWGAAVRDHIKVEMDWTSTVENGENQQPKVVLKHIDGHFGLKEVDGKLVEITEETLVEGYDYTLVYPEESKAVGTYNIQVKFPLNEVQKDDMYDYICAKPEYYGFEEGINYYITATANDHVISYELNGGKNNPENPELYQTGTAIELKAPTRVGYTFEGWFTTPDFKDGTQITKISATDEKDYTLYAKWVSEAKASYKITYVLNGADYNPPANPTGYTGEADLALQPATKKGYEFKGWFFDAAFTKPAVITKGMSGDVTVYAKFTKVEAKTYTIYTDVRYGSISDNEIVEEGKSHVVTYKANDGYVLASVTVDGVEVDITKYPTSYTFENITGDHEISVMFKKAPVKEEVVKLAQPKIKSIVAQNGKVTVKWNKVTGAASYKVYRSSNGGKSYTLITTTKKLTYTTSKVQAAKQYKYKIQAVKGSVKSKMSAVKSVTVLAQVKNLKVTSNKNKTVALKWNKVKNAKKYVVYKSTNGGKTYKKVLTTSKNTAKFKKLKKGSKIRYKVRAINGNSYGKFSTVKKVTVKK